MASVKERDGDDGDKDKSKLGESSGSVKHDPQHSLTPQEEEILAKVRERIAAERDKNPYPRQKIKGIAGYVNLLILNFIEKNKLSKIPNGKNTAEQILGENEDARSFRVSMSEGKVFPEVADLNFDLKGKQAETTWVFELDFEKLEEEGLSDLVLKRHELCYDIALELGYNALRTPKFDSKRVVIQDGMLGSRPYKFVCVWHDFNDEFLLALGVANPEETDPKKLRFNSISFGLEPISRRERWRVRVFGKSSPTGERVYDD